MNKVSCLSIDVVNADKPTASLAFLAGVCEHLGLDYQCQSLNVEMLRRLSKHQFQALYDAIKLGTEDRLMADITVAMHDMITVIEQYKPDVLLVSFFSYAQINLGRTFLQLLRERLPELEILAGGPGIHVETIAGKTNGRRLADQGLIDYYVLGEGDEVLPKFLLGNKNQIGLNSKRTPFENWVPQIDDLDSKYIVPSYKKIDFSVYNNLEAKSKGVINISTSRGCVRACTFCDVSNTWPKFRFRSGQCVAQEVLQHWQDTGIANFHINDSLINGSLKSFKEFNSEMIKLKQQHPGLADFSYNGMFIVRDRKSHNEEFFANMARAGCDSLAVGVETGSDKLREIMAKKFTNDDLDWHMEMCQKYKIGNIILMFVGHPEETQQDYQQSLDLLDRYQKYLLDDTIVGLNFHGPYTLLTGTPDWERRHEMGVEIVSEDTDGHINWVSHKNPTLTVKQRVLRDLNFRRHAANLRYGIAYSQRYIEYLKNIDSGFIPVAD